MFIVELSITKVRRNKQLTIDALNWKSLKINKYSRLLFYFFNKNITLAIAITDVACIYFSPVVKYEF